jgi:poly-gamma-glutamate capsule biosynthesis protein CapA/YwtB (metallophosphatase superfamily)
VVVHWGENYRPVDRWQKTIGRAAIDLGADVVIGHHPHQAQPVELYKGKPIVYSLGNFAFGTIGRNSMRFGMGAALHLEKGKIAAVEFIPLLTQNRIVNYQPRIPTGKNLDRFFKELISGSSPLGARIIRRGDRGWLELKAD